MISNFKLLPGNKVRYGSLSWNNVRALENYQQVGFKNGEQTRTVAGFINRSTTNKLSKEDISVDLDLNGKAVSLPAKLSHVAFAIDEAKAILDFDEGWDGLDANKIDWSTFERASSFLLKYSVYILDSFNLIISSPEINPVSDGTIDLVWRISNARLLLNIKKADSPIIASYYGDLSEKGQAIKNVIENDSIVEHLAFWMKNLAK